jgi:hypothetical protein
MVMEMVMEMEKIVKSTLHLSLRILCFALPAALGIFHSSPAFAGGSCFAMFYQPAKFTAESFAAAPHENIEIAFSESRSFFGKPKRLVEFKTEESGTLAILKDRYQLGIFLTESHGPEAQFSFAIPETTEDYNFATGDLFRPLNKAVEKELMANPFVAENYGNVNFFSIGLPQRFVAYFLSESDPPHGGGNEGTRIIPPSRQGNYFTTIIIVELGFTAKVRKVFRLQWPAEVKALKWQTEIEQVLGRILDSEVQKLSQAE